MASIALQSNKAILFYLTQNSVSEILFSSSVQRSWAFSINVLHSMGSKRVRHDWVTKLSYTISTKSQLLISPAISSGKLYNIAKLSNWEFKIFQDFVFALKVLILSLATNVSVLVSQSFLTLCDPMDCSPPDSSVHRILQARILE